MHLFLLGFPDLADVPDIEIVRHFSTTGCAGELSDPQPFEI
jgi:hypothetical protein